MTKYRKFQARSIVFAKKTLLLACLPLLNSPLCSATSVNLVVNGSFEADVTSSWSQATNLTGWTGIIDKIEYGLPSIYGVSGATGNQVAEVDANIAGANTGFYQLIPTQNKQYTLSVDLAARANTTPENNGLEIWWRNGYVATVLPSSTTFSTYTFNVQGSGGNDRLEIRERSGYDDSFGGMVDNVVIMEAVPYTCGTKSTQLVVNGSFEADVVGSWTSLSTITGWTGIGDTIEFGQASIYGVTGASGKQVVEIDANVKSGVTGFYQEITTQNKTYTLAIDLAARGGTDVATNGVEIWWRGQLIAVVVPTVTSFTTYKFNVPGSGGKDRLELRERAGYDESVGGMIDNVSIIETSLSSACGGTSTTSTSDDDTKTKSTGTSGAISWREVSTPPAVVDTVKAAKALLRGKVK